MFYLFMLFSLVGGSKFSPQNGTYIVAEPIGYYNSAGVPEIVKIQVMNPQGEIDNTYNNVLDLHSIESNPNFSVLFISTVTYLPVDTVHINRGEGWIAVVDYEPETLGMYVEDPAGILKTSIPVGWFVDPSSSTNVPMKAKIEGPDTTNSAYSPAFIYPDLFYFSVIDSFGLVDTSVGGILDTTVIHVKILGDSDTSAGFYDPIADTYFVEGPVTMFSGRGWLYVVDYTDVSEEISIVAEDISSIYDFGSDTFTVYFTTDTIATKAILFPVNGQFGTYNVNKVFYGLALMGDGPDPSNSSSQISLSYIDPYGMNSVTITPSNFRTLASGATSFKVLDTEADSFVFVTMDVQGSPYLYPFNPLVITSFKDSGVAVQIASGVPYMVPAGETINIDFWTVDGIYSFDSTYNGWLNGYIFNGSGAVFDTLNQASEYFPFVNGHATLRFVSNTPNSTVGLKCRDAEGNENAGYVGNWMSDEAYIQVRAVSSSANRLVLKEQKNIASPYTALFITVAAVDDSGYIDPSCQDTVVITGTGSAIYEPDTLALEKGIGGFWIYDIFSEVVYVTATSSSLGSAMDTIYYIHPDSAAYIVLILPEEACLNESADVTGYIFTPEYALADYYNGFVSVGATDNYRSNSVYFITPDPESVPVNNGIFTATLSDTEPEYITVTAQDVKGLLVPDNEDMTFYGMLDTRVVGPHRVNCYDTIQVFLRDVQGNRIYLDGVYRDDSLSFSVSQIGGSNAYSVSMPDGDRTTFVDGFCSVRIMDSEVETLKISTFPYNADWYHGYETASYIGITGISEPSPFQIKLNTVQKGVLSFQFGMNAMGSVSIELFDIAGRCVFRRDMILKPGTYTVVRENLPSGVYYLRLSRGKQQVKGKVVYIR